uniref:EB domain-containing protein n=1 Tax=Plectus sambesii TaxID=2011161 RepID=A0A914V194_9BILA
MYNKRMKKCTAFESTRHWSREKRQSASLSTASGSQRVGERCSFNTDCVSGGYCQSGFCTCWSTHVAIQSFCWRKVNPEQAGCSHDEQCSAVWPGAKCSNSVCKCPNDRTPSPTREGPVCHAMGHCPTNGIHPLLYNRNTNTLSRCFFFDLEPELPKADRFLGCDDFPDMY